MSGPDAVYEHCKREYEAQRDIVEAYAVNTGDTDALIIPPWTELSKDSQMLWIRAYGEFVLPRIMMVISKIPEVKGRA